MDGSFWLPDFVAEWYDELLPAAGTALVRRNRQVGRDARQVEERLRVRPHGAGLILRDWIAAARTDRERLDRLCGSLEVVSRVMEEFGITRRFGGGEAWDEIRDHFMSTGNLLRTANGFLLPGSEEEFAWKVLPPERAYDLRFAFPGFVRGIPQRFAVDVRYVPDVDIPIESLRKKLNVGVVPLVADIGDFNWIPVDSDPPRFRVSLREPDVVARQAAMAVSEAGRSRCDVLVFPELCFDVAQQQAFGSAIARATRENGGYPWLIVAGSSYAPADEQGIEHHNRTLVFDGQGRELLRYNKLHPYDFSMEEQERYGLAHVLGSKSRIEDIVTVPPTVGVLQTAIGRIAVLICEDIWNLNPFLPILQDLAVDWLLVPVLDGIQHKDRWTARNAGQYAEHGTTVIVATSKSLVEAHRVYLNSLEPLSPLALFPYVGLLVTPSTTERIRHFEMPRQHFDPSILTIS